MILSANRGSTSPDHAPGGPAFRLCIYCDARSYIW